MAATSSKNDPGLSADELKRQMFQAMQNAGVLHKVKSQLRQNMINELRGKRGKKIRTHDQTQSSDLLAATIRQHRSKPWLQQAIDNIVLLHIKQSRYQYSLSLFQQESGLDKYQPSITNELLSRLGLKPYDLEVNDVSQSSNDSDLPASTSTPIQIPVKDEPLLWQLLDKLSNLAVRKVLDIDEKENTETRNEVVVETKPQSLSEKFKAIDEEMNEVSSRRKYKDPNITVSTLSSAVRRAEEDAERRWKIMFEQWKMNELSKMRIEEGRKAKQSIDVRLKQLEAEYQLRRNELTSREKSAVDRLNIHREQIERDSHEQRQALLRELEQLKTRDDILRQKEKFLEEMETIKLRELEIAKAASGRLVAQEDDEPEREEESIVSKLADSLKQSLDGTHVMTQVEMSEIVQEMEEKSREIGQLKSEVKALTEKLASDPPKHSNAFAQENKLLKEQLNRSAHLQQQEAPVKTAVRSAEAAEQNKWREEVERLRSDRNEQRQQQSRLEEMVLNMQKALQESNQALLRLSGQSQQAQPTPPAFQPTQQAYVYPLSTNHNASKRDTLRDYEPLDARLSVNETSRRDEISSAHLRIGIRNRLKYLEDESDTLKEEYDRYLRTNYKQLMQSRSSSRAPASGTSADLWNDRASARRDNKSEPHRPHFLTQATESSPPSVPFTHSLSDMRPAFLRSAPPDGALPKVSKPPPSIAVVKSSPAKDFPISAATPTKNRDVAGYDSLEHPAVRPVQQRKPTSQPAAPVNESHTRSSGLTRDRLEPLPLTTGHPTSAEPVNKGAWNDESEDSTLTGEEVDADYMENVAMVQKSANTLPLLSERPVVPLLFSSLTYPDGAQLKTDHVPVAKKRLGTKSAQAADWRDEIGQESSDVMDRPAALDESGPFQVDSLAPSPPDLGFRRPVASPERRTQDRSLSREKSDESDNKKFGSVSSSDVTSGDLSLKLSRDELDDLLSDGSSPKTKSSASSAEVKIDTVRRAAAPAAQEERAQSSENNSEVALSKQSSPNVESERWTPKPTIRALKEPGPMGSALGDLPPLSAPQSRLPPIGGTPNAMFERPAELPGVDDVLFGSTSEKEGTAVTSTNPSRAHDISLSEDSLTSKDSHELKRFGTPDQQMSVRSLSDASRSASGNPTRSPAPVSGERKSLSSSVSEVEELLVSGDGASSGDSVDRLLDLAAESMKRDEAELENEDRGRRTDLMSSISSASSLNLASPGQANPDPKQAPLLESFDDDEISAALKWGQENQPRLEESDDDAQPPVAAAPHHDNDEPQGTAGAPQQEEGDVFQLSASQISLESDDDRKSKSNDSDFSW